MNIRSNLISMTIIYFYIMISVFFYQEECLTVILLQSYVCVSRRNIGKTGLYQ
jgi:hypothetical protein